jgi:hypothetical protein
MRRPLRTPVAAVGLGLGLVLVVIVFGVGQLVLPRLAASRVRAALGGTVRGLSVSVSAFPAIELLWHHADRVTIHMRSYTAGSGPVSGSIAQAGDVGHLTVTAAVARLGVLTVHDAVLTGRSGRLSGSGTIAEADLRGTIPFLRSITPVASSDGTLTLRGTAEAFGVSGTIDADVVVRDGAIVAAPSGLLGSLASVTVFSDPHVTVQSLTARAVDGGLRVSGSARVH